MASVMTAAATFSARQYVISYTDFFRDEVFTDAVVYTFIMSAQDDEVFTKGERVGHRLVETVCHPVW